MHIIIGDIQNKLLSEGLATYFGGSGESDYFSLLPEFSNSNYPLTDDKLLEIYAYPNFKNYYIFGALLCEEVFNNKGVDGLKSLVDCEVGDDIVVERICKLLNVSKTELINKINERIKF